MKKTTLGQKIAELRKAKGLTQLTLAQQLNIKDKAVSKWERDISCPDINTFPKLAEIIGVSVEELIFCENATAPAEFKERKTDIDLFAAIALAMGVAIVVLSVIKTTPVEEYIGLAGIGILALAIAEFRKK